MRKRLLPLILTLALCLGLLVTPAAAYGMTRIGERNVLGGLSERTYQLIDENDTLWMWGSNVDGILGNGTTKNSSTPAPVLWGVASATFANGTAAAVLTDGSLWMWGNNSHGEVGNGTVTVEDVTVPVKVMDNVVAVACGLNYTAAIQADGSLWTWGYNKYDRLGNGGQVNAGGDYQTLPVKVMDNVVSVACGEYCTLAVQADGSLWGWGYSGHGQMGGDEYWGSDVPVKIMDGVAAVSSGGSHALVLKKDGSVWGSGYNLYGQVGNGEYWAGKSLGDEVKVLNFVKVLDNAVAITCGQYNSAAIQADGSLLIWGNNGIDRKTPTKMLDNVVAYNCEWGLALKTDGTLWKLTYKSTLTRGRYIDTEEFKPYDEGISMPKLPVPTLNTTAAVTTPATPAPQNIAYPSTQEVDVDGQKIEFQCYALKDAAGNDTNYIKLRDLAAILNGSAAQFEVGWNGDITITTKTAYTPNGTEQNTPFSGQRSYEKSAAKTLVDGVAADLDAIVLNDDNGGGYTYYKLRDLGSALGITVDWSTERGIYIETK